MPRRAVSVRVPSAFRKATVEVRVTEIRPDKSGHMQELSYKQGGRIRREQYCGTREQVSKAVDERIADLKRMKV
jgi:hypothetical protein